MLLVLPFCSATACQLPSLRQFGIRPRWKYFTHFEMLFSCYFLLCISCHALKSALQQIKFLICAHRYAEFMARGKSTFYFPSLEDGDPKQKPAAASATATAAPTTAGTSCICSAGGISAAPACSSICFKGQIFDVMNLLGRKGGGERSRDADRGEVKRGEDDRIPR